MKNKNRGIRIIEALLWAYLIFFLVLGSLTLYSGIATFVERYGNDINTGSLSLAAIIDKITLLGQFMSPSGMFFTISLIAATILTVIMQRASNNLHREEFENNKTQQESANKLHIDEYNNSRKDIKKDNYENNFFQLLNIYENIISSMKYINSDDNVSYFKREVFFIIYDKFTISIDKIHKGELNASKDFDKTFKSIYNDFYSGNQEHIGHYFRTIYQIMKLIDNQKDILTIDERKYYSGILRAQLSSYELLLMFYNCISEQGKKLKKYSIDYDLLKHIDKEQLLNIRKDDFWKLYTSQQNL